MWLQAAREATAQQFRRSCINLEDAMKEKAHLQKVFLCVEYGNLHYMCVCWLRITIQALEQAAIGSGLKELQERLKTEVSKRESAERMLASVQVYSKPCAFFAQKNVCMYTLRAHTAHTHFENNLGYLFGLL
jgi:hypothetical protein